MIEIYDTTLRDGSQRTDISFSVRDKLHIAERLDHLGIAYIEGGWPGSNPKDVEFFRLAAARKWKHASIAAFGSTCGVDKQAAEDANIQALLDSQAPVCTLVGKTSLLHVREVLRTTPENNLRMIGESVAYLHQQGRKVIYDAEHFFDGYKDDPEYARATLNEAWKAGAQVLVLCDTNGGSLPAEVRATIAKIRALHPEFVLGIHTHNDGECAVANTLAAVEEGCVHVQGTINGYGERCGNANLCSVIPNLELKLRQPCLPNGNLALLTEIAHFVAETANLAPDEHQAYVGKAAFAHKGGIHVAAMRRNESSYQHIQPDLIGNASTIVVSELSGRGNLLSKIEEYRLDLPADFDIRPVLDEIKHLESRGFSFEAADASTILLIMRKQSGYTPPFELIDFATQVEHRQGRGIFAEATVKVKIGSETMHTAGDGNGPVNALDTALRKALVAHFPSIKQFHLSDYKVRILDSDGGTDAMTRVLIETTCGSDTWTTVGASPNIIEASWFALYDSLEYGLAHCDRKERS